MKIKICTFLNKRVLTFFGLSLIPEKLILEVVQESHNLQMTIKAMRYELATYKRAWSEDNGGNA